MEGNQSGEAAIIASRAGFLLDGCRAIHYHA
jgi:hypothetical protein